MQYHKPLAKGDCTCHLVGGNLLQTNRGLTQQSIQLPACSNHSESVCTDDCNLSVMCLCNSVLSSTGCQLLQFCSGYSLILELNHCPLVNCGGFSKLLLQMKFFLDSYSKQVMCIFLCRFISFPTYYTRLIACNCSFDPIYSQTDNIQIPFYHDLDKPSHSEHVDWLQVMIGSLQRVRIILIPTAALPRVKLATSMM